MLRFVVIKLKSLSITHFFNSQLDRNWTLTEPPLFKVPQCLFDLLINKVNIFPIESLFKT